MPIGALEDEASALNDLTNYAANYEVAQHNKDINVMNNAGGASNQKLNSLDLSTDFLDKNTSETLSAQRETILQARAAPGRSATVLANKVQAV